MQRARDLMAIVVTAIGVVASIASDNHVNGNDELTGIALTDESPRAAVGIRVDVGDRAPHAALSVVDTALSVAVVLATDDEGAAALEGVTATLFDVTGDERVEVDVQTGGALVGDAKDLAASLVVDAVVEGCAPCERRYELELAAEQGADAAPFTVTATVRAGAYNYATNGILVDATLLE